MKDKTCVRSGLKMHPIWFAFIAVLIVAIIVGTVSITYYISKNKILQEMPLFGTKSEPIAHPGIDYLAEKKWSEPCGVFMSSLDEDPDISEAVSFRSSNHAGQSGGSRSVAFHFDSEKYVNRQFSLTGRTWFIWLFTETWKLFSADSTLLEVKPQYDLLLPVRIDLDSRHAVFLEIAFQTTARSDKIKRQYVAVRKLQANHGLEVVNFPLHSFVLDRTYQPMLALESINAANERFDSAKSGIIEQIQFKLFFCNTIPGAISDQDFRRLLSDAARIPDDTVFLETAYNKADGGFRRLDQELSATDLLRIAAILHVNGFGQTAGADASGTWTVSNPVISSNRMMTTNNAIIFGLISGSLTLIVLLVVISVFLLVLARQKNILKQVLMAQGSSSEGTDSKCGADTGEDIEAPRTAPGLGEIYKLTRQESIILSHLCEGKSDKAIAAELNLSPRTVSNHVASMLKKTGACNRYELALLARNKL